MGIKKVNRINVMEKLELKHIAPYLPYGLKYVNYSALRMGLGKQLIGDINNMNIMDFIDGETVSKPILKPLSDLTQHEMDVIRMFRFHEPKQWTKQHYNFIKDVKSTPTLQEYRIVDFLFSKHFDVFGLIKKGLAIDINTLK